VSQELLQKLLEAHRDLFKPGQVPEDMHFFVLPEAEFAFTDGLSLVIDEREENRRFSKDEILYPFVLYANPHFTGQVLVRGYFDDAGFVHTITKMEDKELLVQGLFEQMTPVERNATEVPEAVQEAHRDLFKRMSKEEADQIEDTTEVWLQDNEYMDMYKMVDDGEGHASLYLVEHPSMEEELIAKFEYGGAGVTDVVEMDQVAVLNAISGFFTGGATNYNEPPV